MIDEDLLDIEGIAKFFNTSQSTVYRKIVCHPTFPRPTKIEGMQKRWWPKEVKEWASEHRV